MAKVKSEPETDKKKGKQKTAKKRAKKKTDKKEVKTKKNQRCNYQKENLNLAVEEALGGKSIASVAKKYNVPESTVRARKMGKYSDKRPGPATALSEKEENDLVEWTFCCSRLGFSVTKHELIESVKLICDNDKRKTPFANNRPGRSWLDGFMKRHPNIVPRISENLSLNRAKVSEYKIRSWFSEVTEYLNEQNLSTIDPGRVFSADETGIPINPKASSVSGVPAPNGCKNVYKTVNNNEKDAITVLVTANAAGKMAPPLILFAGKSVPKDVFTLAPANFNFGFSDNGWMTAKNFYDYVANVFHPWLMQSGIELPIILYIDGHSSHITLPLSKFCQENEIVLVGLYPNATQILQPLDVSLFRSLKVEWHKLFKSFCQNYGAMSIIKCLFAIILKHTFESLDLRGIVESGFKTCGLYPLDVNAIDYKKVFERLNSASCDTTIPANDSEDTVATQNVEALTVLENLIEKDKLELFKAHNTPIWTGRIEDKSLSEVWCNSAWFGQYDETVVKTEPAKES